MKNVPRKAHPVHIDEGVFDKRFGSGHITNNKNVTHGSDEVFPNHQRER